VYICGPRGDSTRPNNRHLGQSTGRTSVVIYSHRLADVLYIYICCFITKILSSCRWSIKIHLSCTVIEIQSLKEFVCNDVDLLGSRDVIGHVTIGLGLATFLLVINDDHASILHGYRDTGPQRFSTPTAPLSAN